MMRFITKTLNLINYSLQDITQKWQSHVIFVESNINCAKGASHRNVGLSKYPAFIMLRCDAPLTHFIIHSYKY